MIILVLLVLVITDLADSYSFSNNVPQTRMRCPRIGVSFSPSGLMTAFQIGASSHLKECGVISENCALAGSSGGSLVALASALDISPTSFLETKLRIAQECRDKGTRTTLGLSLQRELETILTDTTHEVLNNRAAPYTAAYTQVSPVRQPQFIKHFTSKADLISVLSASCNIPFYSSGNTFGVPVRGGKGIDGFFSTDKWRFGCPVTGATDLEVLVCPYPRKLAGLSPRRSVLSVSTCEYDLITPDLLLESSSGRALWPYTPFELLAMSIAPPRSSLGFFTAISDDELREKYTRTYNAGVEAARIWSGRKGLSAEMPWGSGATTEVVDVVETVNSLHRGHNNADNESKSNSNSNGNLIAPQQSTSAGP